MATSRSSEPTEFDNSWPNGILALRTKTLWSNVGMEYASWTDKTEKKNGVAGVVGGEERPRSAEGIRAEEIMTQRPIRCRGGWALSVGSGIEFGLYAIWGI